LEVSELNKLISQMGLTKARFYKKYKFTRKTLYNWFNHVNKPSTGSVVRLRLIENAWNEFEEKINASRVVR